MENIVDLIETVFDETDFAPDFVLRMDHSGQWIAKVCEGNITLLDREGDRYLSAKRDTPEAAIAALNQLCA
jgi:hypothetical protein